MTPAHRLRSGRDFRAVLRTGRSVPRPEAVVYYAHRADGRSRIGFVVSRRLGGAVQRNRAKRLLREAFRPLLPRIASPVDIVVVARESLRERSAEEVSEVMAAAVRDAGLLGDATTTPAPESR